MYCEIDATYKAVNLGTFWPRHNTEIYKMLRFKVVVMKVVFCDFSHLK